MFDVAGLNGVAVLAMTIFGFLLGGLWYGPLFGRAWMAAVGKTEEQLRAGGSARPLALSFLAGLVSAVTLGLLVAALGADTLGQGAAVGLLTGVGLVSTGMGSDMAFRGDSLGLWLIQSGYRVAYCAAMGAVLAVWH